VLNPWNSFGGKEERDTLGSCLLERSNQIVEVPLVYNNFVAVIRIIKPKISTVLQHGPW